MMPQEATGAERQVILGSLATWEFAGMDSKVVVDLTAGLEDLQQQLDSIRRTEAKVQKAVAVWNENRDRIVLQRLRDVGLGWCGLCKEVVSQSTLQPIFVQRMRTVGSCHEREDIEFRDVRNACPDCFVSARRRCGERDGNHQFLAFEVRGQKAEFEVCWFGSWQSLPDSTSLGFPYGSSSIPYEVYKYACGGIEKVPPSLIFGVWNGHKLTVEHEEIRF